MIQTDEGQRVLVCDDCDDTFDVVTPDEFQDMIQRAKRQGWVIRPRDGEWLHSCGSCAVGGRLNAARKKFGA